MHCTKRNSGVSGLGAVSTRISDELERWRSHCVEAVTLHCIIPTARVLQKVALQQKKLMGTEYAQWYKLLSARSRIRKPGSALCLKVH